MTDLLELTLAHVSNLLSIIDGLDEYQKRPERGEWGVECACCRGELFDSAERLVIEAARASLSSQEKTL